MRAFLLYCIGDYTPEPKLLHNLENCINVEVTRKRLAAERW